MQRRNGLPEKEGQAAEVGVAFYPDARKCVVDGGGPAVVFHIPQVAVAGCVIAVDSEEMVLGQFENDRDQDKELVHNGVVDVFAELVDCGPCVEDHLRMWTVVSWNCFWDVVDLRVVKDAGGEFADSFGFVTVIAPILEIGTILELFLCGEVEEGFTDGELFVYFFLGEAEVGDVEEADFVDGMEELTCEFLFSSWRIEERQIQGYEVGPVHCMPSGFKDLS